MTGDRTESCEYSELTIPNDPYYVHVAESYVNLISEKIGFDAEDIQKIKRAVAEAVANVIEHAFEPLEKASLTVGCERVPLGIKITVRDNGLPFDPLQAPECSMPQITEEETGPGCGIFVMKEFMDEVSFNNLGRDGKETVLVKYLKHRDIGDYYAACELIPFPMPDVKKRQADAEHEIRIRKMKSTESVEVSKCVYRAYGYSYSNETAYYPERLVNLNENGKIISAVAVTEAGEIAGHSALIRSQSSSRIAELGMGVVKPEYRSRGIFGQMSGFLIEEARSEGLEGLYGRAVTNHIFSQRMSQKLGLLDIAILLGYLPANASFKGITEKLSQRETLAFHFMYLGTPGRIAIYPPAQHLEMITKLYRSIGADPDLLNSADNHDPLKGTRSILKTGVLESLGCARIDVEIYGEDVFHQVKAQLKDLCIERIDIINLYLDLRDPYTAVFTGPFEELGFFFSGILPGENNGEALILQYLNNVPIDYSRIQLESVAARELLDYIRGLDHDSF